MKPSPTKKIGEEKMEKVVRICEITGKMMVVANNLTTEQAKALIREKSKEDFFGEYRRVTARG